MVILKPKPYETSAYADVLYRSVEAGGAMRRVIVTRPKTPGRYPAVLLVGGPGCSSLDGQLGRPDGDGPILRRLAERRFVTMRIEKPGEGDSDGPLCTDGHATADLEALGYVAGLRALKRYDFVDPDRLFVFAHSLGPLLAAITLPEEPVRGLIAAETIGRSWFEYMLENSRRQSVLAGTPLDMVDAEVRSQERCLHGSLSNTKRRKTSRRRAGLRRNDLELRRRTRSIHAADRRLESGKAMEAGRHPGSGDLWDSRSGDQR